MTSKVDKCYEFNYSQKMHEMCVFNVLFSNDKYSIILGLREVESSLAESSPKHFYFGNMGEAP